MRKVAPRSVIAARSALGWTEVRSRLGEDAALPGPCVNSLLIACELWWAQCCTTTGLGCWHNGIKRPVLKHGPRSATHTRVFGCQTRARNESKRRWDPSGAPSTGLDFFEGSE